MTTIASSQDLAKHIEKIIREHLMTSQALVKAAVDRAFADAEMASAGRSRARNLAGRSTSGKRARQQAQRRTPEELKTLSERFYAAVCKMPGETMMKLAGEVGVKSADLAVPVLWLKRDGRVRSVGQRAQVKYFPMISKVKADKGASA